MNAHVLELRFASRGKENILYPVLLECDQELLVVECGYHGGVVTGNINKKLDQLALEYARLC